MRSFFKSKKLFLIFPFLLCLFILPLLQIDYTKKNSNAHFPSTKKIKNSNDILFDYKIEQVSTGYSHAGAVISNDGTDELYTWGTNGNGQLGLGPNHNTNYNTPQKVEDLPEGEIKQISMGNYWSAAVVNYEGSDHLYTWGNNQYGQLGLGDDANYLYDNHGTEYMNTPQEVTKGLPDDGEIKQISMQGDSGGAIVNNEAGDVLYTWGSNEYGQLGLGEDFTDNSYNTPQKVTSLSEKNIKQVVMEENHSAAIVNDGNDDSLYTWGENNLGQLGPQEETCAEPPDNANHQNRHPEPDPIPPLYTPQKVEFFEQETNNIKSIEQISLGNSFSGALTTDKKDNTHLYTWGTNKYGQLGYGKKTKEYKDNECIDWFYDEDAAGNPIVNKRGSYYDSPHEIDDSLWNTKDLQKNSETSSNKITQISFGTNFASVVVTNTTKDGEEFDQLYTWGQDQEGQLGINSRLDHDDTYANINSPQPVFFQEDDIKTTSMGRHYGFAITSDEKNDFIYSWGSNGGGQLGLGDKTPRNAPELIWQNPYIKNIKSEVTPKPNLDPKTGNLTYSFETPLDVKDVTIEISSSENESWKIENSIPKQIETNLYLGKESFYNLKNGKEYTYKIYLNYWSYIDKEEQKILIAEESFTKEFWDYNKWLILFIAVILLFLILLIALIIYLILRRRDKNVIKRRIKAIRKTVLKEEKIKERLINPKKWRVKVRNIKRWFFISVSK